jgi:oligoendopeptidase F
MSLSTKVTGAETVQWDLSDLYPGTSSAAFIDDKKRLESDAASFASEFRGKIATLNATELSNAIIRYEMIQDIAGRLGSFAYLTWSTDTLKPENGKLLQEMTEFGSKVNQNLIFFGVEWLAVDDDHAKKLIDDPVLSKWKHYLEVSRLYKDHTLDENQEQVISVKSVTGRNAWVRLFDETLSAATFELDGEELSEQEVLSKLHNPDRDLRRRAAESLTEGLKKLSRPLTYIFNTLLVDKKLSDEMRKYPHWLASRNLANEISDHSVEALVEAVESRYDIAQRYYRLKARLLGMEGDMKDYDRYAPVFRSDVTITWEDARKMVTDSYDGFDSRLGEIVKQFFDKNWVDAAIKPGKRSGAFSASTVPSVHPYILMNYDGRIRDVQTLAHELGHGVHQYLSRDQGILQADTPLTTAETASVFGEMLVFKKLYNSIDNPKEKLGMLLGKIDDTMATVYRQIAMNRFEDAAHNARRNEGELTAEHLCSIWRETQTKLYGDSVTLTAGYDYWWSYIPHFVHTPGYVYAYAFGELLVLSLYEVYLSAPEGFSDIYVDMLAKGGSDWPENILKPTGLDIKDSSFWKRGVAAIEKMLSDAEQLAEMVEAGVDA